MVEEEPEPQPLHLRRWEELLGVSLLRYCPSLGARCLGSCSETRSFALLPGRVSSGITDLISEVFFSFPFSPGFLHAIVSPSIDAGKLVSEEICPPSGIP